MRHSICLAAPLLAAAAVPALAAAGPVQTFPTSAGPVNIVPIYHAAVMIEADGERIYIDPAKPANIRGLSPGDLILITDIHGDHMDADDIKALSKAGTDIIAPASVQATITAAKPLANGASTNWHKWKITAVPMYNTKHLQPNGEPFHTKGRGDGYVLSYGGKNFYFAGDTAYAPHFRDISRRLGAPDLALLPIGAYEPRWFMKEHHMDPHEAVIVHKELGSDLSVGMHFGTFQLTDEAIDDPVVHLKESLVLHRLPQDVFLAPENGQTISFSKKSVFIHV